MGTAANPAVDEIGPWSEIKLAILKDYASAYSRILSAQRNPSLFHVYIDAFAGGGFHLSERTGELVPGSPRNALAVEPPFREYHFIDLNPSKVENLREMAEGKRKVFVYEGDCNEILPSRVLPRIQFRQYRRALCLLDPYGLHLNWNVLQTAGEMGTIDMFLNFPIVDMNRNVLWHEPERADPAQIRRMNAFWGDESWRKAAYTTERDMFGLEEKLGNEDVVRAFRDRLRKVAGFKHVAEPRPIKNRQGSVIYYLFFASQKPVAENIVHDIFQKDWEKRFYSCPPAQPSNGPSQRGTR